jgi:hypothetical protein
MTLRPERILENNALAHAECFVADDPSGRPVAVVVARLSWCVAQEFDLVRRDLEATDDRALALVRHGLDEEEWALELRAHARWTGKVRCSGMWWGSGRAVHSGSRAFRSR